MPQPEMMNPSGDVAVGAEPMQTLVEMLIDAAVRRAHLCDDPVRHFEQDAVVRSLRSRVLAVHGGALREQNARQARPCGAGLDDAPMLQEVAFHLRLAARELPEGHHRELIEGHRRQLLDLSGRILAAASPIAPKVGP